MSSPPVILHAFADEAQPARALASALGIDFRLVEIHSFPDGEVLPTVRETAPTTIVYRSMARPNDKLIPLLLACDAWRRAGARRLILVAPYLCYLRQDAVFSPGQPNSQQVIGDLLGDRFDRIVTVDAHLHRTPAIAAVFPQTTATDLSAASAIAAWLTRTRPDLNLVVGPDVESEPWVRQVATALHADYRLSAEEALDLVGLADRMDHFPAQLSGGEQQRVAVARAIAKRPAVLLCDEPTGALDLKTGVRVLEALVEINRRYRSTTLIVTHNADVARLGERVIHFADGRIGTIETNTVRAPPSELKW